jgi:hypothetical protein
MKTKAAPIGAPAFVLACSAATDFRMRKSVAIKMDLC